VFLSESGRAAGRSNRRKNYNLSSLLYSN